MKSPLLISILNIPTSSMLPDSQVRRDHEIHCVKLASFPGPLPALHTESSKRIEIRRRPGNKASTKQ